MLRHLASYECLLSVSHEIPSILPFTHESITVSKCLVLTASSTFPGYVFNVASRVHTL